LIGIRATIAVLTPRGGYSLLLLPFLSSLPAEGFDLTRPVTSNGEDTARRTVAAIDSFIATSSPLWREEFTLTV